MTIHSACAPGERQLAGAFARRAGERLTPTAPPDSCPAAIFVPPVDPFEMPDDVYGDLFGLDDPEAPTMLSEENLYDDDLPPMTAIDQLEWELWAGVEQDDAERFMLRQSAPAWVFLPPGGELATALESVRIKCLSPMALIEFMKATSRLVSWAEANKAGAMASFFRQRKAEAADTPRPKVIDSSGRPVDPERSWAAEVGAALHLSTNTAVQHIDTALHLTGPLAATLTALRTGALSHSKALAISEATRALSDEDAQAVESHVLRRGASQTHANLRRSLRHQVAKHQADVEVDRHREAVRERTCKLVPLPNGMAGLWIVHTADNIQKMWVVVRAMADLAKRPTPESPQSPAATAPPTAAAEAPVPTEPAHSPVPTGPAQAPAPTEPAEAPMPTESDADAHCGPTASAGDVGAATPGEPMPTAAFADPEAVANPAGHAASSASRAPAESTDTEPERLTAKATTQRDTNKSKPPQQGTPPHDNALQETPPRETPPQEKQPRDERTAEQRRADSVADLFEYMLENGLDWLGRRLPDQHRRRPHIEVLIPVGTLLGLDDEPCELTGYGPIPAEMARRISERGTWRRLLTDPATGVVLEAATTRHDPSPMVSETLLARHPVCAWPGCNRASRECDRDHGTPFAVSQRTSLSGLAPYCEYHHVIKDTPGWGWRTENHPDGSVTLTAPTGHRYTTVPPARGPITRQPKTRDPESRRDCSGSRSSPAGQQQRTSTDQSRDDPPPF
ncbi:DUF222 domain-containing protein [Kribbella antibiotica]|uniref:DUF222 domain-containing protein n=1 Tax=Kribbella antibiotica TaxID=190195 RepID=A0A4R4YFE3_9ACTN|nr:DUF222 domain-containing protein [Kribbella antibiotica]TDD43413.1 DUF222 domain-containing protein [Kribbella antibiotica]